MKGAAGPPTFWWWAFLLANFVGLVASGIVSSASELETGTYIEVCAPPTLTLASIDLHSDTDGELELAWSALMPRDTVCTISLELRVVPRYPGLDVYYKGVVVPGTFEPGPFNASLARPYTSYVLADPPEVGVLTLVGPTFI